ncbi:MAG: hypothetical protein WCJ01_06960 [Ignavibacteria bacterium]
MRFIKAVFFLFFFGSVIFAQVYQGDIKFEFLPAGLHFQPLKGNNQEAKIGVLYYSSDANLKVDIGNSIDILGVNIPEQSIRITSGIEFLAYAYSTSFRGNRLQIDATDGLFGGNVTFSQIYERERFIMRLRVIHHSAHFVDGHYDLSINQWIGGKKPIPFTRDFGELTMAYEWINDQHSFKLFGTPVYSTLVRPSGIKKLSVNFGFEYALFNYFGEILGKDENLFLAYYDSYIGTPRYRLSQNTLLGIKFGDWHGKGIVFYLNYYSGNNVFNEYYKDNMRRFGIGFNVDFN